MRKVGIINLSVAEYFFVYPKKFIVNEIINPISPSSRMPNADIFEISLNSFVVGFLSTRHTLMDLAENSLRFLRIFMLKQEDGCF